MSPELLRAAVDVVVILSLGLALLAAIALGRISNVYAQVHTAAIVPFLSLTPLALVQAVHGDVFILAKALLVVGFLLLTGGVTSHVIARAEYRRAHRRTDDG
jgi:monovalent cation/proton antiporter MnhG/PhaG subunit